MHYLAGSLSYIAATTGHNLGCSGRSQFQRRHISHLHSTTIAVGFSQQRYTLGYSDRSTGTGRRNLLLTDCYCIVAGHRRSSLGPSSLPMPSPSCYL